MSVKFVTPHGWPSVVEGYIPPTDWHPEPSWPDPPLGWSFYVDEAGAPAAAPVGAWQPGSAQAGPVRSASGRKRPPMVIAAAVLVVALAGAGAFAYFQFFGGKTVTIQQFAEMAATHEIGGVVFGEWTEYKDEKPDLTGGADREAKHAECAAMYSFLRQHLLRVNSAKASEKAMFAELYDSSDAAKQSVEVVRACFIAEGSCYYKPLKNHSQDGAEVILTQGASTKDGEDGMCVQVLGQKALVIVDNVMFGVWQIGNVEPDLPNFVAGAIAEVRSVTGR